MNHVTGVNDLLSLDGRAALVTGGAGGIGSSIVRTFLDAGASVASLDLPGKAADDRAMALPCDLTDADDLASATERYHQQVGRLDILVHCAGITRDSVLWKLETEAWSEVMRVNLDSAFLLMQKCVPIMRDQDEGSIVLISSINGERGKFGQANYAASKAGLIGLGRTAARELGRFGIRVNIIAPGFIETEMTASLPREVIQTAIDETVLGRAGEPGDVARAALFLVSPMARHITGQVLRVDGGQLIA